ncbi:hypothetical protein TeGR_g7675, partial [Tetraparma gracilis]
MDMSAAQSAFDSLDASSTSLIEVSSLPSLLSALNVPLATPLPELEAELDRDGNGLVPRSHFLSWYKLTMSPPSPSSASASGASLTGSELLNYVTEMSKSASAVAASDIHSACWNGDLDLVERYCEIDPTAAHSRDDSEFGCGYRPLHYAAYSGHLEVCKFLLENPAVDMDCATATGCTALFLAAQQKRREVADYLLRQGADASKAEDGMGYTAMDVAR